MLWYEGISSITQYMKYCIYKLFFSSRYPIKSGALYLFPYITSLLPHIEQINLFNANMKPLNRARNKKNAIGLNILKRSNIAENIFQ